MDNVIFSSTRAYKLGRDKLQDIGARKYAFSRLGNRYRSVVAPCKQRFITKAEVRRVLQNVFSPTVNVYYPKTRELNAYNEQYEAMHYCGETLVIGCQRFEGIDYKALKKWAGVK